MAANPVGPASSANSKKADINRLGHTSAQNLGTNPRSQATGRTPRDERAS